MLATIEIPELQKQRLTIEARMLLLQAEEQRAVAGVELAAASVRLIEAKLQQAKAELGSANASLAATFTIAASYILALTMMPNRKAFMASYYPPH